LEEEGAEDSRAEAGGEVECCTISVCCSQNMWMDGVGSYQQTTSSWELLHGTLQSLVHLIIVENMLPASQIDAFVVICEEMTRTEEVA
jgi:hypothetical protein